MSWGTDFNADIFISGRTFKNKYELQQEIEFLKNVIIGIKTKILMYSVIKSDACIEYIDNTYLEMNGLLDDLIECNDNLFKLELLLNNFNEDEKRD